MDYYVVSVLNPLEEEAQTPISEPMNPLPGNGENLNLHLTNKGVIKTKITSQVFEDYREPVHEV